MITENKEVFKIQIVTKVASINLDNIEVKLNSITMKNEDDDDEVVFKDRQWDLSKERCSEGIKISLYIVNDGNDIQERMDWLLGEEYIISAIDAEIINCSTGEFLEYEMIDQYGEQTTREIKVQVSENLEIATCYLVDRLTEGNQNLKDIIFKTLKEDEYMQNIIKEIATIPIL